MRLLSDAALSGRPELVINEGGGYVIYHSDAALLDGPELVTECLKT